MIEIKQVSRNRNAVSQPSSSDIPDDPLNV